LFVIPWLRIAVFDAIKNGMASKGDPFEQFHGVGFEQSSLAEVPPLGMSSVITNNVAHIARYRANAESASSPFDSVR
jgi:hypothetical protein